MTRLLNQFQGAGHEVRGERAQPHAFFGDSGDGLSELGVEHVLVTAPLLWRRVCVLDDPREPLDILDELVT